MVIYPPSKVIVASTSQKKQQPTHGAAQLLTCSPYTRKLVSVAEEKAKVAERNDRKRAREENELAKEEEFVN